MRCQTINVPIELESKATTPAPPGKSYNASRPAPAKARWTAEGLWCLLFSRASDVPLYTDQDLAREGIQFSGLEIGRIDLCGTNNRACEVEQVNPFDKLFKVIFPLLPAQLVVNAVVVVDQIPGAPLLCGHAAPQRREPLLLLIHPSGTRGEKLSSSPKIRFWKPKGSSTVTSQD